MICCQEADHDVRMRISDRPPDIYGTGIRTNAQTPNIFVKRTLFSDQSSTFHFYLHLSETVYTLPEQALHDSDHELNGLNATH
jgi:hypothetical protein